MPPSAPATNDLLTRAARVTPGGVHSNVRLGSPRRFFTHGKGSRLWDVDGRDYIDYLLGQGPAFLGHGHPGVHESVREATAGGMVFGAQHPLEVVASEQLLAALRWPQRVRFGVSGTESVQAALRLARAVTGRRRIMRFTGHYHGWLDNVLMAFDGEHPGPATEGQNEADLRDWVLSPFNDAAAAQRAAQSAQGDLAAIIVEPMMCNAGAIPAHRSFLLALRALADQTGAVLIFDEVITGFRLALGGAAEHYSVTPDLAVYGKAVAGGWPVSVLAGSAELMDHFGTGRVNHSGTFNASVMACAAVSATLTALEADPPYTRIAEHGSALMTGIRESAQRHEVPLMVEGLPAAFHVAFGPLYRYENYQDLSQRDTARYVRLAADLADGGVWVAPRGIWYVSAAHSPEDLGLALSRIDDVFSRFEQ